MYRAPAAKPPACCGAAAKTDSWQHIWVFPEPEGPASCNKKHDEVL